jgi:two-component system, OmpR family, phosphate regulon response regulator PhoB
VASVWHQLGADMTTVLIADDEPAIVELVRATLEDPKVRIVQARDGAEALALARTAHPDLILLDVRMPEIDGINVCRRLRSEPALRDTCIVMLTAAAQEAQRLEGRAAGADEYLTKPFSPLRLLQMVRALLPEAAAWPGR